MREARAATQDLRIEPAANGPVLMVLCLLVGLTPLVFAATLFQPYLAAKEIFIGAGAATVLLIWLFTDRLNSWIITPIWIPLGTLVLIAVLSLSWSSHPAASLEEIRQLVPYLLLFVVAAHIMRSSDARSALTTAIMLTGTIEAAYILLQFSVGDPVLQTEGLQGKWRTFGTLGNPNWAGEFLAVADLVTLGRVIDLNRRPLATAWARHASLAAFILMFLGLIATLARGAWVSFAAALLCFVFLLRRSGHARFPWKKAIVPAAITVLAAAALVLSIAANSETLRFLFNTRSLRGRVWLYAVTFGMIRDAPLLGCGVGTFPLEFPLHQANAFAEPWSTAFIANASFTSFAHNDLLQIWAELGLIGLAAFCLVIWMIIRRGSALASDPVALGCWAAVVAILINAVFAFPLHLPTSLMLFTVLIGVVESAAAKSVKNLRSLISRAAIAVPLIFACILAYYSSYQRLITESALWQAETELQAGDEKKAEEFAFTAIAHAPLRSEGYAILGRAYLQRGEGDEAIEAFDQAMRLGFDADVSEKKAEALERAGKISEAIAVMNDLVRLRPDIESARQRLAELTNKEADLQEDQP